MTTTRRYVAKNIYVNNGYALRVPMTGYYNLTEHQWTCIQQALGKTP